MARLVNPRDAALDALFAAQALADWKEGGPVKETAERAAARAEKDFFRLLFEQRIVNMNNVSQKTKSKGSRHVSYP